MIRWIKRRVASLLIRWGHWTTAAQILGAVVNADIDDSAARRLLAWTLLKLERFEEAAFHFRDLMIEAPHDVNAPYSLAECLVAMKRYAEAIQILQQLTNLDPSDADALNLLATVHVARGEYQDALLCYRRTIRLAPDDPVELTNYAATLMALGHHEEVVEVTRKALSLRPHAATAFNLGDALIRLKRWAEAIGPLRQSLTLEPWNDDTRVVLATALTGAGQYDQAAEVLREVADPTVNGRALALLSHVHQKRGRISESIETARAALRASPRLPEAYLGLGFALLVGGHYSEALEAFREAQRLDPPNVAGDLGTGASLAALGEHQAASTAFARALSREPDVLVDYPEIEPFIAENRRELDRRRS